MDSRVITITSGKGGVGKTTTTANIGTALALQGKKVAVVDSDIGLRNLDAVLGLENRIVYDLVDVVEGQCRLRQALIKDKRLGLVEAAGKPEPRLILNRLRSEMVKRGDMMDVADVLEVLGIDLLGIVPEDEMIIVATNKGEPVVYDKRSRAGRSFLNAAQRIMGEEIPLDEVTEVPSLLERLRRFVGFGPALAERRVRS